MICQLKPHILQVSDVFVQQTWGLHILFVKAMSIERASQMFNRSSAWKGHSVVPSQTGEELFLLGLQLTVLKVVQPIQQSTSVSPG